MRPIVLIGIAGAGKSTSGRLIAEKLAFEFVDTDKVIEERFGKTLDEVLTELGKEGFSELEGEVFIEHFGPDKVLAPGGSIVYQEKAMKKAHEEGFVVYIELSLKEWRKRVGSKRPKGFLLLKGRTLEEEYSARAPLYSRYAHFSVNGTLPPEEIADRVVKAYSKG